MKTYIKLTHLEVEKNTEERTDFRMYFVDMGPCYVRAADVISVAPTKIHSGVDDPSNFATTITLPVGNRVVVRESVDEVMRLLGEALAPTHAPKRQAPIDVQRFVSKPPKSPGSIPKVGEVWVTEDSLGRVRRERITKVVDHGGSLGTLVYTVDATSGADYTQAPWTLAGLLEQGTPERSAKPLCQACGKRPVGGSKSGTRCAWCAEYGAPLVPSPPVRTTTRWDELSEAEKAHIPADTDVTYSGCHLSLSSLEADDVCPQCECPAREHRGWVETMKRRGKL